MSYKTKINKHLSICWAIHDLIKLRIKTREFLKENPKNKDARKYMIISAIYLIKLRNKRIKIFNEIVKKNK